MVSNIKPGGIEFKNQKINNMRILQVNKFFYERGGADKYFLNLSRALEEAGHEVAFFSMVHPNNHPTPFSSYFVSRISFNEGGWLDKFKAPGRIIYSLEAKRKFKKLVLDFKPDIIHIHNIYHQISPSILDVAGKYKIPVVMHLHDYKLVCPNYQLFVNGKICEACKQRKYYKCFKKRCFKKSPAKSLLATIEMYFHHSILKIYKKHINCFIAPSVFIKNKIEEFGWLPSKIKVILNPFSSNLKTGEKGDLTEKEDYLLYFGRLSPEKGLEMLIKAAAISNSRLKFAGSGQDEDRLKKIAEEYKVDAEFLGFKSGEELRLLILKARAVVIPSLWYENMPLSLLEALSLGKIVIASNIGGMPEIIKNGENGLLFNPGDINDLSNKIKLLDSLDFKTMENKAENSVNHLTIDNNLNGVVSIYRELISKK